MRRGRYEGSSEKLGKDMTNGPTAGSAGGEGANAVPTAAERIANWTTSLRYEDIPADVLEHAKQHVLDTLGCGLAAHATGVAGEGRSTMAELGGEPQATVIGLESGLPSANAAFALP